MKKNYDKTTKTSKTTEEMGNIRGSKNAGNKQGAKRGSRGAGTGSPIPRTNDSSWYTSNPKLVEASARVPFPYRPGMLTPKNMFADVYSSLSFTGVNTTGRVPGVFAIDWVPSVGVSSDVTSPISIAAKDIFSRVRSAFSGSIQADAPDFVIHMMAMDSIYAYISYLKRIYKTLITFNPDNQITPEVLLQAMRWSPADIYKLMANKVQLFGIINELVSMANRFVTPNVMPVMQRHVWMSERVYCDAPMVNSQMYLFNLTHVYKFGVDSNGAGQLTLTAIPTSGTVDDLFTFGRELIEAVSNWDDGYVINGYLAKAYEGVPRFAITELTMDDRLEMVYNEVVLSQIENATCPHGEMESITGTISQEVNSNALISTITGKYAATARNAGVQWTTNRINCRQEQPSAVDTIEATRLMTKWEVSSASAGAVSECGTEAVWNFRIMNYVNETGKWDSANVNNMVLIAAVQNQNFVAVTNSHLVDFTRALGVFGSFGWHPIMLTGFALRDAAQDAKATTDYVGILGDIHNITFISDEDMAYINRCCLYSEFGSFGA